MKNKKPPKNENILWSYRMQDIEELAEFLRKYGKNYYMDFINRIYGCLMQLKPGEKYSIIEKVRPENREFFIKVCDLFIQEGNPHFRFTPDVKFIYRITEEEEKELRHPKITE